MDAQFWIQAWKEGRTGFHRDSYHEKLVEHFPKLKPQKGQKVLVPLCGKTKDLLWLHDLGLHVHGVELHEEAVKAFFAENKLSSLHIAQAQDFTHYSHSQITVSCGDFFRLDPSGAYDLIYDRGSLVALPPTMRQDYAQVIKRSLKKGGKYLLIVYEYEHSQMDGPPFSIDDAEIRALYHDGFVITLLESTRSMNEGPRLSAVPSLKQKVYSLVRA